MGQSPTFGVIGAGNGGLAVAGQLAINGKDVTIYDIVPEVIEEVNRVGGIYIYGKINGFGKIKKATTELRELVERSNIIMVVVPAVAHRMIAKKIANYINEVKTIVLTPGATGGSLEFYRILKEHNPESPVIIAETQSLFYACRSEKLGCSTVYGIKDSMGIAALPATKTEKVIRQLVDDFPQLYGVESVLKSGLENINAIVHPVPTLLNAGLIDKKVPFKYYWEGITPAVGKLLETLDEERLNIGRAFGLDLTSTIDWMKEYYDVCKEKNTLYDVVISNKAYENIYAPDTLNNRFITEDIPMGLIPMAELGKIAGVSVRTIESVINFSEALIGSGIKTSARTLARLGLEGLSITDIKQIVEQDPKLILRLTKGN